MRGVSTIKRCAVTGGIVKRPIEAVFLACEKDFFREDRDQSSRMENLRDVV